MLAYRTLYSFSFLFVLTAFNPANVVAKTPLVGSNNDDVILGITMSPDFLAEYRIRGLQGNDLLSGAFGNDVISGNEGDDIISGELPFLLSITTDDDAVVLYFSGDDILHGNEGNDVISGEAIDALVGVNGANNVIIDASDPALSGRDIITGGKGDDELYGFFRYQLFSIINADNTRFTVRVPGDILIGGEGNDLIVGYVGTFYEEWNNATNLHGDVAYNDAQLIGNSGNDKLVGDFVFWYFEATGPCSGKNKHQFGHDTLIGGPGNDILIGDLETHITKLNICGGAIDQTEQYGEDELIGGLGDDTLVGDALNITIENAKLVHASDTFVFSLGTPFGHDVIKDLNAGGVADTLKFENENGSPITDISEVDANITSILGNANNDVVIQFNNDSSITLEDISFTGQVSISDFGADVVEQ